jgi:hypothetical protein
VQRLHCGLRELLVELNVHGLQRDGELHRQRLVVRLRHGLRAERELLRGLQRLPSVVSDVLLQHDVPVVQRQQLRLRQYGLHKVLRLDGRLPQLHFGHGLHDLRRRSKLRRAGLQLPLQRRLHFEWEGLRTVLRLPHRLRQLFLANPLHNLPKRVRPQRDYLLEMLGTVYRMRQLHVCGGLPSLRLGRVLHSVVGPVRVPVRLHYEWHCLCALQQLRGRLLSVQFQVELQSVSHSQQLRHGGWCLHVQRRIRAECEQLCKLRHSY